MLRSADLPVTDRQKELVRAIYRYLETEGCYPTFRELVDMLGVRSTEGIVAHLRSLQKKGVVQRDDTGQVRSRRCYQLRGVVMVPRADPGSVVAGILAEEKQP